MPKSKKKSTYKPKLGDLVLVTWRDTTGTSAWASTHEPPAEPIVVDQPGFFLSRDSETLYIAGGLPRGDCQMLGPTAFPAGCVVSIKKLKT